MFVFNSVVCCRNDEQEPNTSAAAVAVFSYPRLGKKVFLHFVIVTNVYLGRDRMTAYSAFSAGIH